MEKNAANLIVELKRLIQHAAIMGLALIAKAIGFTNELNKSKK
jgi:hypothetical protein